MRKKPRLIGAAGGAVGLSGFAAALALCCTVPWAVALLGVTGAIAFARLAFLVPYALIGSVLLFVAGFWLAYRRPEAWPRPTTVTQASVRCGGSSGSPRPSLQPSAPSRCAIPESLEESCVR